MTISIITATYNAERTIENAIHSVLSQTYPNIEYIIIDGKSTDGTIDIINKHKNQINYFISEPDNGIYDALNKGIERATGDIIGFLHADDAFKSENTIENIAQEFKTTNADGVYGDLEYVNSEDTQKVVRYWKSKNFKPQLLTQGWMPAHPTLFLKKEIYKAYGLFNINFHIAADYDFILRIFKNKTLKFTYIPMVITQMRLGGASNKSLKNLWIKTSEDIKALKINKVGGLHTIIWKNLSKLPQFFKR